ncbi:hypothetical protein KR032_007077 [Drosophila birchii]|nr:hypothetical protein KR032_007077 [Drosophila birchii]
MRKLKIYFLFAYSISFILCGSLAESEDNVKSECPLQEPPNQCGQFCLTALKPIIDHIALHRQEWNICGAAKVNETLSQLETPMEVNNAAWKKDFESRLENLESGLNKSESQHTLILQELSTISKRLMLQRFDIIGTRYFYVENSVELSWTAAEQTCREMGGHLAGFRNEEEYSVIQAKLDFHRWYWVGINDRDVSRRFVSVATGSQPSFLRWGTGAPSASNNSLNCVLISKKLMWDFGCNDQNNFICQAEDNI